MRFAGNRIFLALASVVIVANAHSQRGKREMFFKCYGSSAIASQFARGIEPSAIVASWTANVARFKGERSQYLLY
jgi:exo-beta-N-acetylmuramidase NamZ-like protein